MLIETDKLWHAIDEDNLCEMFNAHSLRIVLYKSNFSYTITYVQIQQNSLQTYFHLSGWQLQRKDILKIFKKIFQDMIVIFSTMI